MTKRYTIFGVRQGETNEREIAQCDTNPLPIAEAANNQNVTITSMDGRRITLKKWYSVRIHDNITGGPVT